MAQFQQTDATSIGGVTPLRATAMASPDSSTEDDQHWSLEKLNKAYQQGYMAGMTGQTNTPRAQTADVLVAAWEAGWDDGHEQFELHKRYSA